MHDGLYCVQFCVNSIALAKLSEIAQPLLLRTLLLCIGNVSECISEFAVTSEMAKCFVSLNNV